MGRRWGGERETYTGKSRKSGRESQNRQLSIKTMEKGRESAQMFSARRSATQQKKNKQGVCLLDEGKGVVSRKPEGGAFTLRGGRPVGELRGCNLKNASPNRVAQARATIWQLYNETSDTKPKTLTPRRGSGVAGRAPVATLQRVT